MKTTIDLPEDLVRQMKLRAVREGRKLKEVAGEVFRRGMAVSEGRSMAHPLKEKIELPLFASRADAPAAGMRVSELIALEQESLAEEDRSRAGPAV